MERKYYLLNLVMSGVKNIDKEIAISFYKKKIDSSFDNSAYRTKAIYGENGSGKTAIVTGVQLLQDFILTPYYLNDIANQKYLHEIVNKKTETLHLECEFCESESVPDKVYRYSILVQLSKFGDYVLKSEKLEVKSAAYTSARYHEVFRVESGELFYETKDEQLADDLKSATVNLLNSSTLFMTLYSGNSFGKVKDSDLVAYLTQVYLFALSIVVDLDISDRQKESFTRRSIRFIYEGLTDEAESWKMIPRQDAFNGDTRIVQKDNYEEYQEEVSRLERFIKLFKTNLKRIEIDKKERYNTYECALIMDYDEYKVHINFESTGIKKLVRLFDYMSFAANGKIVFIDEMDSNINDVYLCKMVEFFKLYGEGQLCFTTHSTSPMEVLRDSKNAIDFLSSDSHIVPWRKNGNFTPESMYRRGMIQYLPFNLEAEDFLGILGD